MAFHRHYGIYHKRRNEAKHYLLFVVLEGTDGLFTIGDDSISVTLATSRLNTKNTDDGVDFPAI